MNTDRILYHGSPNTNINKLDIGKAKESGDQYGNGIYLTTNIKDAEVYAGPTGRVYKITLDPSIKLFSLDGKLPDNIVQYLQFEKDNMSEDMYNNICSRSRIQKSFTDKQEALKFSTEKKKEYVKRDNRYSRNMPKASVEKTTPIKYIVTYTDYDNINNAISELTGDDLYSIIIQDATPNTFVDLITSSGYDGIITHNNEWVIIYKNIDKVNILNESKVIPLSNLKRLDEVSRNQLIAKTKSQTITRYKKAAGYKGFSVVDIDTTSVFTRNCFRVTCRVGDYWDTIEMENILFWIQVEAEKNKDYQINAHGVRDAILNAADGVDIRVDCSCPDFCLEENTNIKLLNGEVLPISKIKEKFDNNEEMWVYSTDSLGDFRPGKVTNVWVSGYRTQMVKITLDNGKEIITTPEHRYMKRDGSYCKAADLEIKDSLMPLYFSYHNGYENVKRNSQKSPTIFDSVYKIVASTELSTDIEAAKTRSGEEVIQIHHKDFNKLNNYPSNLRPMGKHEHWMYHAKLGKQHKQSFIEAGRKFWTQDLRRFEALERQKKAAREYQLNMWKNFTAEERAEYIAKSRDAQNSVDLSKTAKTVWDNYTDEEKQHRIKTNSFVTNNPMKDAEFLKSEKCKARNNKISQKQREFHKTTTPEQRSAMHGWSKGLKKSEETRKKMSESRKRLNANKPPKTAEELKRMSEIGKKYAYKNKESRCRRNIQELIDKGVELTSDTFLANRRPGDPHYLKVYESFEDMLQKLEVPNNINHKVVSIEYINYEEPIPVYDLEVAKYHNFYVDAGVMLHNCYRFSFNASQGGYKYGKLETRPAIITNPNGYGALCKHLTAMLSNKKWLQQVAGTLMDFLVDRIDDVNRFLRVRPGEELTIPNELARQNAKKGFYSKLFKDKVDTEEEEINDDNNESNDDNIDSNDDTNNDSTNMASNRNNNSDIKDTDTNLENNTSNDSDTSINDDTNIDKK